MMAFNLSPEELNSRINQLIIEYNNRGEVPPPNYVLRDVVLENLANESSQDLTPDHTPVNPVVEG